MHLADEARDGAWSAFAAWQTWIAQQMPEESAEAWLEAENDGCWQHNLYAIMSQAMSEQLVNRERGVVGTLVSVSFGEPQDASPGGAPDDGYDYVLIRLNRGLIKEYELGRVRLI
jgi:hypothetical protein